jgi:hypothetical protein
MLKRLALASALSALFAGGTLAQTPTDPEECLNSAYELDEAAQQKETEAAENKNPISDEQIDRVQDLLITMQDHCDASRYNEAMAIAQDLKDMIEKL